MKRTVRLFICVLLSLMTLASPAIAEQGKPGDITTSGGGNCREQYEGALLAVIIPCVRQQVMEVTVEMTQHFSDLLLGAAVAFMTLVVTLFGVKVLTNEGDPKKDAFILLLKLGIVWLFLDNFGGFIPASFNAMLEGSQVVTSSLGTGAGTSECANAAGEQPWNKMDCILGAMFGFDTNEGSFSIDSAASRTFVGASLVGVVGSALWSSQFGATLFVGIIALFFFVLQLFMRAIYTYLMCVVVMAFLIVISPLLIPLMLMPITSQYFERPFHAFLAVMMMPWVVLAYLTLSIGILERIAFDEDIGVAVLFSEEGVKEIMRGRDGSNATEVLSDPAKFAEIAKSLFDGNELAHIDPSNPFASGAANTNILTALYTIDFKSDEASKINKMLFGIILLILAAYLLDQMLDAVIKISQIMLGGAFFMQAAVADDNPIEGIFDEAQQKVSKTMSGAGASGGLAGVRGLAGSMAKLPGNLVSSLNPFKSR